MENERIIIELEKSIVRLEQKLVSSEEALKVSKETLKDLAQSMEKRLDSINRIGDKLDSELINLREYIRAELKPINTFKDIMENKASRNSVYITITISILSLLVSVVALIHK